MTLSNLYITLSNDQQIIAVADSSSAPEQEYFVEYVLLPLLNSQNADHELFLLQEQCTVDGLLRINADYRYEIDLVRCEVGFFEERYDWGAEVFRRGKCLNDRLFEYLKLENVKGSNLKSQFDFVTKGNKLTILRNKENQQ